jgi:hypothetical protein
MRSFLAACVATVVIAISAAVVLDRFVQQTSAAAFTLPSADLARESSRRQCRRDSDARVRARAKAIQGREEMRRLRIAASA